MGRRITNTKKFVIIGIKFIKVTSDISADIDQDKGDRKWKMPVCRRSVRERRRYLED